MTDPNLILRFRQNYEDEYNDWAAVTAQAEKICRAVVETRFLPAEVSSRTKKPESLGNKIRTSARKRMYTNFEDIQNDITDLAGVRILPYYEADYPLVLDALEKAFVVEEAVQYHGGTRVITEYIDNKPGPVTEVEDESLEEIDNYIHGTRFKGITHLKVKLRDSVAADQKYSPRVIEIQVGTLIMHAWATIAHNLLCHHLDVNSAAELSYLMGTKSSFIECDTTMSGLHQASLKYRDNEFGVFDSTYSLVRFINESLRDLQNALFNDPVGDATALRNVLRELGLDTREKLRPLLNKWFDEGRGSESLVCDSLMRYIVDTKVLTLKAKHKQCPLAYPDQDGVNNADCAVEILRVLELTIQKYIGFGGTVRFPAAFDNLSNKGLLHCYDTGGSKGERAAVTEADYNDLIDLWNWVTESNVDLLVAAFKVAWSQGWPLIAEIYNWMDQEKAQKVGLMAVGVGVPLIWSLVSRPMAHLRGLQVWTQETAQEGLNTVHIRAVRLTWSGASPSQVIGDAVGEPNARAVFRSGERISRMTIYTGDRVHGIEFASSSYPDGWRAGGTRGVPGHQDVRSGILVEFQGTPSNDFDYLSTLTTIFMR